MGQFRYLGKSLTNQNSIHEKIKRRLKSGNACYHSVQNLLSSSLLSKGRALLHGVRYNGDLCVFKNKAIARVGTAARFADLYAGQLARGQFSTGRACDRPFQSRFFHIFPRSCGKC